MMNKQSRGGIIKYIWTVVKIPVCGSMTENLLKILVKRKQVATADIHMYITIPLQFIFFSCHMIPLKASPGSTSNL